MLPGFPASIGNGTSQYRVRCVVPEGLGERVNVFNIRSKSSDLHDPQNPIFVAYDFPNITDVVDATTSASRVVQRIQANGITSIIVEVPTRGATVTFVGSNFGMTNFVYDFVTPDHFRRGQPLLPRADMKSNHTRTTYVVPPGIVHGNIGAGFPERQYLANR